MVVTKSSEAQESGWAQVRKALKSFVGDVVSVEEGEWGGEGGDFIEISCVNVVVLTSSEELSMTPTEHSFRVNTSNFKGSFWIDKFVQAAEAQNVELLDGMVGKRIVFEKVGMPWESKDGRKGVKEDFVIAKVEGKSPAATPVQPPLPGPPTSSATGSISSPMDVVLELAQGKTEAELQAAVEVEPRLAGNPLLSLIKNGVVTKSLIEQGKLALVEGVYKRV